MKQKLADNATAKPNPKSASANTNQPTTQNKDDISATNLASELDQLKKILKRETDTVQRQRKTIEEWEAHAKVRNFSLFRYLQKICKIYKSINKEKNFANYLKVMGIKSPYASSRLAWIKKCYILNLFKKLFLCE